MAIPSHGANQVLSFVLVLGEIRVTVSSISGEQIRDLWLTDLWLSLIAHIASFNHYYLKCIMSSISFNFLKTLFNVR